MAITSWASAGGDWNDPLYERAWDGPAMQPDSALLSIFPSWAANSNTWATETEDWEQGLEPSLKLGINRIISNANLEISANGSGNVVIDDVDIGGGAIDGTTIGANSAAAGTFTTLTANTSVTIDGVTITDNTVSANASNANLELTGNGSGSVTISGFTFPTSDGDAGQFLKTDGAGTLSFGSAGADLSHSDIADATTTVASSATSVMNSFATGTYRSAKYFISIVDSANSRFEIVEANVTHDGTSAYISSFGSTTNHTGPLTTFSADIDSGNVRVLVTNISDSSTVFKFQVTYIDA